MVGYKGNQSFYNVDLSNIMKLCMAEKEHYYKLGFNDLGGISRIT